MATLLGSLLMGSCKTPSGVLTSNDRVIPKSYSESTDTTSSARLRWREFFNDPTLVTLIDTAVSKNLDLMMAFQEIEVAKSNLLLKSGQMAPTVSGAASAGITKVGHYTSQGAGDASAEITPGNLVPSPLNDYLLGLQTILNGFVEVSNELSNIRHAGETFLLKSKEAEAFNKAVEVSNDLFKAARANYLEVLMAQRDALDAQMEVIEAKKQQFNSVTNVYKALGGGWQ